MTTTPVQLNLSGIPAGTYSLGLNTMPLGDPSCGSTVISPVPPDGTIALTNIGTYKFCDSQGTSYASFYLPGTGQFGDQPYVFQQLSFSSGYIVNSTGSTVTAYGLYGSGQVDIPPGSSLPPSVPGTYLILTADNATAAAFTVAPDGSLNGGLDVIPTSNAIITVSKPIDIITTSVPVTFQNYTCKTLSLVAVNTAGDTVSLYAQFGSRCSELLLVLPLGSYYIGSTDMTQAQYGEINVGDDVVTIVAQPVGLLALLVVSGNVVKIVAK
jgi:hypothetical protein